MEPIIPPDDFLAKLRGAKGRVEIRDAHGNLVGYFEPTPPPAEPRDKYWPFTREEIEEALKDRSPGKTLDQIIKEAGLS